MKKNLLAAMLLTISCALFSNAQDNQSTEDLSYLFPEPKSWDFGVQASYGLESIDYRNIPSAQGGNTRFGILRLAFFSQYQISEKTNLKIELSANLAVRVAPTISVQYGYQFAPRWTAYAGLALEYASENSYFNSRASAPNYRSIIPRAQLGVRYQASKSIFLDLRYEADILKRSKNQNAQNSLNRINGITLGLGIKF